MVASMTQAPGTRPLTRKTWATVLPAMVLSLPAQEAACQALPVQWQYLAKQGKAWMSFLSGSHSW